MSVFRSPGFYDAYSEHFNPALWPGLSGLPKLSLDAPHATNVLARGDFGWNGQGVSNTPVTLTYGCYTLPTFNQPDNVAGFRSFDINQRAALESALSTWSDVANVQFEEALIPHFAVLKFAKFAYSSDNARAFSFAPGDKPHEHVGQAWFKDDDPAIAHDYGPNGEGRGMFVREIGHLLGLHTPTEGRYNDGTPVQYGHDAQYLQDSRGYSVMSAFSEHETAQDFRGNFASAPMLYDITAVQHLYGANTSTRAGDTTYGFNSDTGRDDLSLHKATDALVAAVWDGGGYNTFDFSGYYQDQHIDLHQGAFSSVGGLKGNVAIAYGTHIQHAIGGHGNDVLIGSEEGCVLEGRGGDNVFYGGKGGDIMSGGAGHNTYVYSDLSDSTADAPDWILDFKTGQDKIDVMPLIHNLGFEQSTDTMPLKLMNTNEVGSNVHSLSIFTTTPRHDDAHPDMVIKVVGDLHDSDINLPIPQPLPGMA